ncbi:hypothetical protein HDU98_008424 [Podochytrium sp. JEL0797]|nr:hypothetical protein HDU98_008424 [Podochytrium sp. JEL0797]
MSQPDPYRIELSAGQRSSVILNHVGFNAQGPKTFLVPGGPSAGFTAFELLDPAGVSVFTGELQFGGTTAEWTTTPSVWKGDFSAYTGTGLGFRLRLTKAETGEPCVTNSLPDQPLKSITTTTTKTFTVLSERFDIGETLLKDLVIPDVYHYFRSQRVSGKFAKKDFAVSFVAGEDGVRREGTVDVHGGWYDASGDTSKYLSHLSYANFMNPQQTPLITWNLLACADHLAATGADSDRLKSFLAPLREESLYGCDFLMRMQDAEGYFYQTLFDKWSKDVNQRELCEYSTQKGLKHTTWQAAYRQGGGMAIASLARASALPTEFIESTAEYSADAYLAAAESGFKHLEQHNASYCNNGIENIIDHYCALLAAIELYAATKNEVYLAAARERSALLQACQVSSETHQHFWMSNGKNATDPEARPFFHASDAGLPIVALCRYAQFETDATLLASVHRCVRNAMDFELSISTAVNNPFLYPRQYVKPVSGSARDAFFFPHDNESGYWFQGENARLGSLSSAASAAISLLASDLPASSLEEYKRFQISCIDWVLGKNPYDMCMLQGRGRRNPEYLPQFPNAPGGVCNGITGGMVNEEDLAFKPDGYGDDWAQNWRWGEQWIPHAGWLVLAVALL